MLKINKSVGGKDVVSAKELYEKLEIQTQFSIWIKRMIEYGFVENVDYQCIIKKDSMPNGGFRDVISDYALTLDTAKEIAMIQRTPQGKKIRQWLISLSNKHETGEAFTIEQIGALLDLTKAMTLSSIRKESERKHYDYMNKPSDWWEYRSNLLGYSKETLKKEMSKINKQYKSIEKSLILLEPAELIRTGVIDLLVALGNNQKFSINTANLCKKFAIEMKLDKELWNDIKSNPLKLNSTETENKKNIFNGIKKILSINL